jgi:hypothetical protein
VRYWDAQAPALQTRTVRIAAMLTDALATYQARLARRSADPTARAAAKLHALARALLYTALRPGAAAASETEVAVTAAAATDTQAQAEAEEQARAVPTGVMMAAVAGPLADALVRMPGAGGLWAPWVAACASLWPATLLPSLLPALLEAAAAVQQPCAEWVRVARTHAPPVPPMLLRHLVQRALYLPVPDRAEVLVALAADPSLRAPPAVAALEARWHAVVAPAATATAATGEGGGGTETEEEEAGVPLWPVGRVVGWQHAPSGEWARVPLGCARADDAGPPVCPPHLPSLPPLAPTPPPAGPAPKRLRLL